MKNKKICLQAPEDFVTLDRFKIGPNANSIGLINWLRQPGLLLNQPQKSMRVKFDPLNKSCYARTDPAAETKSIGLPADAQLSWFLHETLTTLS